MVFGKLYDFRKPYCEWVLRYTRELPANFILKNRRFIMNINKSKLVM